MADYRADIKDIYFQLTQVVNAAQWGLGGLENDDMKGILYELEKFVAKEIFPSRIPADEEGVKLIDGKVKTPDSMVEPLKQFYDNGWFAIGFPESIGGTEVSEAFCVACTSLTTGANAAVAMYPGLTKAAINVVRFKGEEKLKNTFIPPLIDGRWNGTMCLTEAGAGSDVGALSTKAEPLGDGTYNIKGTKVFISSGESDFYDNTIHLVLARTPGGQEGTKGISLFLVPKVWVNEDGSLGEQNNVRCTKIEEKMGIHGSATCELTFGGEGECRGYLIGDEFDGMATMFIMMNEARLLCGIQGESQGNLAYELSVNYAKERSQFGKAIIDHPDVKKTLLKMRSMSRGCRALSLYTANLFDSVKENPSDQVLIDLLTPICKSFFTDQGFLLASDAVQVHGGYGFCKEYGVEQFVRDTIIGRIYEGTNGIQAIDFVTRKILKDQGQGLKMLGEQIQASLAKWPNEWAKEKQEFVGVLQSGQRLVTQLFEFAQNNQFNHILQHAKDTLDFWSYLVTAWRAGETAYHAHELIQKKDFGEFDEAFLQTKIDDFQVFCFYYLPTCYALEKPLASKAWDISALEI
jgi:alkylation response protein AidB-like acyl-CoA dehydrogenase